jgi:HSP20 family protein
MAVMRWDGGEFDRLRGDMARMFNRVRDEWSFDATRPRTHMHQVGDGYIAEVELAGVEPQQVDIDVDEESVSVHGQFPPCPGEDHHEETAAFHVVLTWPTEVNPDTARADWRHGLLMVQAQKAASHRRRVPIAAPH